MPFLFLVLFLLSLPLSPSAKAHDEHTSEWYYIDERWPKHIGPLIDEQDPDAYIHQVVTRESKRLGAWYGRYNSIALDTVTACGLTFDGYLRQRPRGTYVVIVISSSDKQDHRLKWIPVEYRFDNEAPQYFARRNGSPNEENPPPAPPSPDTEHEDYVRPPRGRPDVRRDEELVRGPYKYLFDNLSPKKEFRTRGGVFINGKFKYIEVLKFPDPHQLTQHDYFQIYLPWVDDCQTKPDLVFKHNKSQEVLWEYPMTAWFSLGAQFMLDFHEEGWNSVHPQPAFYAHFSHYYPHHGFSVELQAAKFHSALGENTDATGFFGKLSYGYEVQLFKYLWLVPELGFREVFGVNGFFHPGIGGGFDLAWEFPGTRHQTTGQRLMFETGCDFQRYYAGDLNGHDLRGAFGACKIGFGLGW